MVDLRHLSGRTSPVRGATHLAKFRHTSTPCRGEQGGALLACGSVEPKPPEDALGCPRPISRSWMAATGRTTGSPDSAIIIVNLSPPAGKEQDWL